MLFFSFSVELRSSQLSLQPPSCRASRHLDHVHHHCCSQSIGCSTASRRRRRPFRPPLTIVELLIINQEEKRRRCVSKWLQRPTFSSDYYDWTKSRPSCRTNSWKSSELLSSKLCGYATKSTGFPRSLAKVAAIVASASTAKWTLSWLTLAAWSVCPASSCTLSSPRNWRCGSIRVKCRIASERTVPSAFSTTNGKWKKRWGKAPTIPSRRRPTHRRRPHHLSARTRPPLPWTAQIHPDAKSRSVWKWSLWWTPAISWPLSISLPTSPVRRSDHDAPIHQPSWNTTALCSTFFVSHIHGGEDFANEEEERTEKAHLDEKKKKSGATIFSLFFFFKFDLPLHHHTGKMSFPHHLCRSKKKRWRSGVPVLWSQQSHCQPCTPPLFQKRWATKKKKPSRRYILLLSPYWKQTNPSHSYIYICIILYICRVTFFCFNFFFFTKTSWG